MSQAFAVCRHLNRHMTTWLWSDSAPSEAGSIRNAVSCAEPPAVEWACRRDATGMAACYNFGRGCNMVVFQSPYVKRAHLFSKLPALLSVFLPNILL